MHDLDNWCSLPTTMGVFRMYDTGNEDIRVISMGDLHDQADTPLLRVHSSCLASEVFGAQDCDCADQLRESMKLIATEGGGMIIHLHQEGRGQGLSLKIRAVHLMEYNSLDTVESFEHLDLEQDIRTYEAATDLLKSLNIDSVRLISNNPRKREFLEKNGVQVTTVNTHPNVRSENRDYLFSKNHKLGHQLPLDGLHGNSGDIRFYHSDQPWGEFSNFSQHSILVEGVSWRTVEHYYQAQKFSDHALQRKIRLSQTPTLAKRTAKEHTSESIGDWDSQKDDVMLKALEAKFTQHPELREQLKATGNRRIVEYTSNDGYWGEAENGSGLNRLGNLLMKVRDKLQNM